MDVYVFTLPHLPNADLRADKWVNEVSRASPLE